MDKKIFIFRNTTVENLFVGLDAVFSGYNDISHIDPDAEVYFWMYLAPVKTDVQLFVREIESYTQQLQLILSQMTPQKPLFAFNMQMMHYIYAENSNRSVTDAVEKYNQSLIHLSQTNPNVKILNFDKFCNQFAFSDLVDWRFYYTSQVQINPKLTEKFRYWLTKETDAIEGKRKKCIVLDLDNTLWGGILGEDDADGIQAGNTYPGNAFLDFQQKLLELSKRGVILAVCSKNNEKDVLDAWQQNPFLKIKGEQLAAWRINWNNKADNIVELSLELNIGLDSMVFIDDNPAERELVKQMLPMVETPDFPQRPYLLPDFFQRISSEYFQIYHLTHEDGQKLEQYKANAERLTFQKSFASFDDYLKSLEIVLDIQELDSMNLPRIAQMTQKTNQFNLTTKRYTDNDINALNAAGVLIYCMSVSDRFGDSGITGVAIIKVIEKSRVAEIDSFLLSCRILGKNIENAFLQYILFQLKQLGYQQIFSTYVPTSKNNQVIDFYDKNGFVSDSEGKDGVKKYSCSIGQLELPLSNIYQIKQLT